MLDSDGRRGFRDGRQDLSILLDVNEYSTRWTNCTGALRRFCTQKLDSTEVSKWNQRIALFKILHNPFSILLAKGMGRGERLCHLLACGEVLDLRRPRFGGLGIDCELNYVSSLEADTGEIVRMGGPPLIPS